MRIPFGIISIPDSSKRLIRDILDSGRVTSGVHVRRLEEAFARLLGTRYAVAVSSGTDADALAIAVLYDFGAHRNDEIIVPALSFVATGNAILQAGFKPVFVDVKLETLNIDVSKIKLAITKKTRAIMPVHLMGKPAEMDEIMKIAKRYDLFVIEDAAEAYGTEYNGIPPGRFGDMGCFSLYAAHVITCVEGGMVVTDNPQYAEILRSLRSHGRACKCVKCILNTESTYCRKRFKYNERRDMRFVFERIGYSSKMNELEAAIGLGQIEMYQKVLKRRRGNLLYLIDKFKQFSPYLTTLDEKPYEKIGPHAFAIIINKNAVIKRNRLVDYLEKNGIETRTLFSSMPTQCAGFKFLGYKFGDFPNAEYIGENGFHIGIHQGMGKAHLNYFIKTVDAFLSHHLR